jgi:hypothetical protein
VTIAREGEAWEIIQNMENQDANARNVWQALKQEFQSEGMDDCVEFETRDAEDRDKTPRKWVPRMQGMSESTRHAASMTTCR